MSVLVASSLPASNSNAYSARNTSADQSMWPFPDTGRQKNDFSPTRLSFANLRVMNFFSILDMGQYRILENNCCGGKRVIVVISRKLLLAGIANTVGSVQLAAPEA
jgi:hypothetical protein